MHNLTASSSTKPCLYRTVRRKMGRSIATLQRLKKQNLYLDSFQYGEHAWDFLLCLHNLQLSLITKLGATMERTIIPEFEIPYASLQSLISLTIILFVPVYDRILVPAARVFTRKPYGITMLQRIGT